MSAIARAITAAGGKAALAAHVGQFRQAVDRWLRTGKVPARHCIAIESAAGGAVTRYDLRPDVFGNGPAPLPATNDTPSAGPAQ